MVEPLPGTAKTGSGFVLMEYPGPWSHDVLDGGTFSPELTVQLKRHVKTAKMGLQLIRKPGRAGRDVEKHNVFLVFSASQTIEHLQLDQPADILAVDLTGPGRNAAACIDHPMLLICTHAKRDRCCAISGRPLAAAVEPQFGQWEVWESSHTKGHRFAPSMLLMPWNYSYGQLSAAEASEMFQAARRNELYLAGNRGRGTLSARGQVAELAVAEIIHEPLAPAELSIIDSEEAVYVKHPDGRQWKVELEQTQIDGVLPSCGQPPKTVKSWVAVSVSGA